MTIDEFAENTTIEETFITLVCADSELLRIEFDAIIAANFPPSDGRRCWCPPRRSRPVLRTDQARRRTPASPAAAVVNGPGDAPSGVIRRQRARQRSPPPRPWREDPTRNQEVIDRSKMPQARRECVGVSVVTRSGTRACGLWPWKTPPALLGALGDHGACRTGPSQPQPASGTAVVPAAYYRSEQTHRPRWATPSPPGGARRGRPPPSWPFRLSRGGYSACPRPLYSGDSGT
jgi:hypothetical protein